MRSESIVGQIIACPRCGSMVEVHSPAEAAPKEGAETSPPSETPLVVGADQAASAFPVVALAGGILVLGVLAIAAVAFWPGDSEVDPQQVASVQATIPDSETKPETTPAAPPETIAQENIVQEKSQQPVVRHELEAAPAAPDAKLPTNPAESEPALPDNPTTPQADASLSEQSEPTSTPSEPSASEVPKVASREKIEPANGRQFNALDFDPESLDLETLSDTEPESPEPKIKMPPRPQVGNVQAGNAPEPQSTTLPLVRRGKLPDDGAATRIAREQFARKLPGIQVREMPLVEFLQLASQLAGVPVSVDAEHLLMAGISGRQRVSIDATDVTLDAALAEVLASLKLEHQYRGPHVVVTRKNSEQTREIEYPLDDLVDSAEDGETLIYLVKQLVAPESWGVATVELDGNSLVVTQSQPVHYELLVFLERLRLVNGRLTRSRFPVERLAPTPLHAAMAARLTGPALFTFSNETPLAEVVQHWQRELDVPILVDWVALAELDLWPEATIVCAVSDRNWQQALDEVLEPLGLDWRVSFGGTIEISTAEQFARDYQLELYPLNANSAADGQQVVKALANHLATVTGASNDQATLLFDSHSGTIIARQPAYVQRAILQWLVKQKLDR